MAWNSPGTIRHGRSVAFSRAVGLVAVLLLSACSCARAQTGTAVRDTVTGTVEIRQQTQQQQDAWAREKDDLIRRYRLAESRSKWLAERLDVRRRRVQAVEQRVAELQRRLREADRLEGSLQDTLQVILERLEQEVGGSLPFLPQERAFRLQTLREDLARPDVDPAEKLRRLLEALQVETGYGSTVEVYQDRITVAGEPVYADILRLGRVALFWMTPDRKEGGVYDQGRSQWVALDARERRRISLAMDMAARLRPVELTDLPVGRIEAGQGVSP